MPNPPNLDLPEQPTGDIHVWHTAINALLTRPLYPKVVKPDCPCPFCFGHKIGRYLGYQERETEQRREDILTAAARATAQDYPASTLMLATKANHGAFCQLAETLVEHGARMTPSTAQTAAHVLASLPPELKQALRAILDDTAADRQ